MTSQRKRGMVCLLLLAWTLSLAVSARAGVYPVAVIQNTKAPYQVNLRAGMGTSTESLGLYYSGTQVVVYRTEGDWCKVEIYDRAGYIQKKFLVDAGEEFHVSVPDGIRDARPYGVVSNPNPADRLHLRDRPLESGISYGKYYNGTEVQLLGEYEGWYHVLVDGRSGFMMAKFVDKGKRSETGSIGEATGRAVVSNPDPADRLHLRKEAKSGATSLGKYYSGVAVDVLNYEDAEWSLVRVGDTVGYMRKEYLRFGSDGDRVASAIPVMTVAEGKESDLYEQPNVRTAQLGAYPAGTAVEILGIVESEWVHVRVEDAIGYMLAKALQ